MVLTSEEAARIEGLMDKLFPRCKKTAEYHNHLRYRAEKIVLCVGRWSTAEGETEDVLFFFEETCESLRHEQGPCFSVAQIQAALEKQKAPCYEHEHLLKFLKFRMEAFSDYSFCNRYQEKYKKRMQRAKWFRKFFGER